MAEIAGTDAKTIEKTASEMGLPENSGEDSSEKWRKNGYITLIRANWHILTYDQLCTLLDIDRGVLSSILREDDFLGEKLGGFKPDVKPLEYQPTDACMKRRTEKIRKITRRLLSGMPAVERPRFDFDFPAAGNPDGKPGRFGEIICYAYGAAYGDILTDRGMIDRSFPAALLSSYRDLGVTGLWISGILYKLSDFPFERGLSDGYEKRLKGLDYLTRKLRKYGLKLYLYLNEPRSMPLSFFDKHPDLLGVTEGNEGTLCVSNKTVRDYLSGAVYSVIKSVPGIAGIITITASENLTNCFSHMDRNPCRCRKCSSVTPARLFAEVNAIIAGSAKRAKPDIEAIAWNWGWNECMAGDVVRRLPRDVSVMCVSEQGCGKVIGGTETRVLDYSISVEGPWEYARRLWKIAKETGKNTYAKIQLNNSWECSSVPYIPVFEKTYRHLCRICENSDVDSLMISWTLGGYPSPFLRALRCFGKNGRLPSFEECCRAAFPHADTSELAEVFHIFSDAFDEFPFSLGSLYSGPQQLGPANPLFESGTGLKASMVGYPYDDLKSWASVFPVEVYVNQLGKLSEKWGRGLELLKRANGGGRELKLLKAVSETCYNHFRSSYLQSLFCLKREKGEPVEDSLFDEEAALAESQAKIISGFAEIGYEPSNHYYYTRYMLFEKVLCCEYLNDRFGGRSV